MNNKRLLIKLHWLLSSQFGADPQRLMRSLRGIPYYISDWLSFRKENSMPMVWMPCLHDRYAEAGTTKSEYFWQDLIVARWIHAAGPSKHVDIGSRVDGFVAHVASFRRVEVFDIRPVTTQIPGVTFTTADMMNLASIAPLAAEEGYCDSLSCLHALEHFGLGRYGDPIDPDGHKKGLTNMAKLLRPGGTMYLSVPIGQERVEFNAYRVFDPRSLVAKAQECGLTIKGLTVVGSEMGPHESAVDETTLLKLAEQTYNLGIFTFIKPNH